MNIKNKSLAKSFLTGSAWTLASVGASQLIRLGKSLILSRLLFPEAYGVMAIVWAVLYALDLLSDVGISPGIVRSPRGNDPEFLNTAWTMKCIRGGVLCLIACVLAFPVSLFFNQPNLALLIPVAGITTLIEGFASTNIYTCQRNMIYGKFTILEFTQELVGLLVTIGWAYLSPSVWALVAGAVFGRIYHVVASHLILPGIRNKFYWDPKAFQELIHFGKWIFFSSVIYLLYTQGDRILLGKYLTISQLGVYSIAIMLSEAASGVINKLNDSVLYPALSQIVNGEQHRLRNVFYKSRLGTDAFVVMPLAILMMVGSFFVHTLYDFRYQDAGWMFQILCVRLLMTSTLVGGASCLFALGHSRYSVIQNICRAAWLFIGIPIAWPTYGLHGIVCVVALTEIPVYFVIWSGMSKYKILSLKHEIRSLLFIGLGSLIGYGFLQLPIANR